MVGILLLTHYGLGESLAECAAHVLGRPLPQLRYLPVYRQDDPDVVLERARALLHEIDTGTGAVVLSDIYGGTPSNVAYRLIVPGRFEAVAGVNLPMLVRTLNYSHESLEIVVGKAVTGGLEGVMYILPPVANAIE
ncbi:PTS sugar transporter subunit IIA [Chitinimonas sp. BJB300]|uniref:PTS sugar transporter subunit IIA n=1 Tax=Chitinimonas sp. BJB300 TaxID=1559339 RepID=UPI000C0D9F62|nr:PTS fructose transporter subunit IIA [Chitinimonas sp. BJB300]PHV12513.1 PTS fructose transporter subunit IIA [Chitinimonas sp. BJB300]TSJ91137.1 PTS fructose transporter subunit IIA [Chitinimonas sp. BJB300]